MNNENKMKLSEEGKKLLVELEGVVLNVYKDQAGKDTIGVGHLLQGPILTIKGQKVDTRQGITHQQAMDLLDSDIAVFEATVNAYVRPKLSQNEFDALVIFSFNVGTGAFQKSTLLIVLNADRKEYVPLELKRWVYAGGKVSQGLKNRRNREINLWKTGEY